MPLLDGKNAIVTGGASGIGYAIAKRFVREGARVIIADLNQERGLEVEEELSQFGDVEFLKTDISRKLDVHNLIASAVEAFSDIDIVVNNAAVADAGDVLSYDEEMFDRAMAVNLKGAFLLSQAAARQMVERVEQGGEPGTILNISSVLGQYATEDQLGYCVSKGGMDQLTRVFAVGLAQHGIRVNAIAPGTVATELLEPLLSRDRLRKEMLSRTPLGRFGEPSEIASMALFLVTPAAAYMTGQIVAVDGGRTALYRRATPLDDDE